MNSRDMASALPVSLSQDRTDRLASLFDVHHPRLYRLARRLTGNPDDALDLVQETFLKAGRSLNSVPAGIRDEEAWLVRVLINIRRDQWRKSSVRDRYDKRYLRNNPAGQNPEEALIAKTAIWQSLDLLPPRRRAVVVMHELEGLDVAAIASLLGISAITVRWHLSIGRRDLVRALRPLVGDTNAKR